MRWSRNLASLADPEVSLPPSLQPVTGQSNPPYTSSFYFFKNDFYTALPLILFIDKFLSYI